MEYRPGCADDVTIAADTATIQFVLQPTRYATTNQ